jgi:predicted RNA-binding protein with PUA domain
LGKSVLNCHSSESVGKIERAIEHLKENPNLSYHRMVTDKKNERAYENSYTSIIDKNGKFIGTAVISKDITEKRNLEEKRARDFKIPKAAFDFAGDPYQPFGGERFLYARAFQAGGGNFFKNV